MSTNALTKAAVLALAAIGSVSAAPLDVRAHEDFQEMMLQTTNWYRSQHGAEPVSWDQGLADYAVNYANACAKGHSVRNVLTAILALSCADTPLLLSHSLSFLKSPISNGKFFLVERWPR